MANEENNFENDEINQLLGSLKRVDAPRDFDFRVRARIAEGRPAIGRSWIPAAVRVAAAILVMLTAGYFGFRSYYPSASVSQQASLVPAPQVSDRTLVEQHELPPNRDVVEPSKEQSNDAIASKPPEMQPSMPNAFGPTPAKPKAADKGPGGGSSDITRGISNVITAPDSTRQLSKDNLSALGIDANDAGSGWTVGEVKQNSRAERSGLKSGDVIESVKGRSVRVRRGSKIVVVTLKP